MEKTIDDLLLASKNIAKENPEVSLELAEKGYELSKLHGYLLGKADAYYCKAYACRVKSDYISALSNALKALEIFEMKAYTNGIIKAKNLIGIIYFYYGDYPSALASYQSADELLNDHNDANLKSSILNNIGELYREASQNDKALVYYEKALKISKKYNLSGNSSIMYLNISEIYFVQEKYEESFNAVQKAYKIGKTLNDIIVLGESETKLGKMMFLQGRYSEAKHYYLKALKRYNRVNNRFYLIDLLINYAQLDDALKKDPTIKLIEALNYAVEKGLDPKISLIYQHLSDYYERINDFKASLRYYKSFYLKEKEIEKSNLSKKLEILSLEFKSYKEQSNALRFEKISSKLATEVSDANQELAKIKVENAFLLEVSMIDELTQVYNRRGIKKQLEEKVNNTANFKDCIMIIDIDLFKKYNDAWGHVKGDWCLQEITRTLKDLPFLDYFLGRYGGEEFLCYLKVKSEEEAVNIANEICEKVKKLHMPYDHTQKDYVTISIGGVVDHMHVSEINRWINSADNNLYYIKENGRKGAKITAL